MSKNVFLSSFRSHVATSAKLFPTTIEKGSSVLYSNLVPRPYLGPSRHLITELRHTVIRSQYANSSADHAASQVAYCEGSQKLHFATLKFC